MPIGQSRGGVPRQSFLIPRCVRPISDSTSEMLGKEKTGEFAVKTEVVQHGLGPANESGSRRLLKVKELRSEPSEKWERGCLGNLL